MIMMPGQSRLREIFLKSDNYIEGRYLAEITKEVQCPGVSESAPRLMCSVAVVAAAAAAVCAGDRRSAGEQVPAGRVAHQHLRPQHQ